MSAMLMPLPPGATFWTGPDAATEAGASAVADSVSAASTAGTVAAGAGDDAPPLAFSARAAASISSTDSFFAMFVVLVNQPGRQKPFAILEIQRPTLPEAGLVIFFTNFPICIQQTTYVNHPCA
jgi:hypothetical protein